MAVIEKKAPMGSIIRIEYGEMSEEISYETKDLAASNTILC